MDHSKEVNEFMTESSLKVSIVLPTYNGARYIRQSIESCLVQTHHNIELVIIDDCSTDNTPDIIKSYNDNRIKYIKHEKNRGLPNSLNTGFANVSGEYLTWTSDDNCYSKYAIEKMLSFMLSKNSSFVYCDFYRYNDINPSHREFVRLSETSNVENNNGIGACFLYTRKVMDTIGAYDPEMVLAEDYDYWIRVSKRFQMSHLNEPLYFYRTHEKSLTSRFIKNYDIQITAVIARLKNDIIDAEKAVTGIINLIAEKKTQSKSICATMLFSLIKIITFNKITPFKIYSLLTKAKYYTKIKTIINNFKDGHINFEKTKLSLKDIVNKR